METVNGIKFQVDTMDGKVKDDMDCVPRSFAILLGIRYDFMRDYFKKHLGFAHNSGTSYRDYAPHFNNHNLLHHMKFGFYELTLKEAARICNPGRFAVRVPGHVTSIIDGVVHDTELQPGNADCSVTDIWELKSE